MNRTVRYEIEWPTSADPDVAEYSFERRPTLAKAMAFARKVLHESPMRLAYVTRQVYTGNGNPWGAPDHEWEDEWETREEVSAP